MLRWLLLEASRLHTALLYDEQPVIELGLDTRGTPADVAPDAPAPTYDSHGNQVAEWSVRIRYDAVRDNLEVHWAQEAGPYHKAKRLTTSHDPQDVEDALADVCRAVRIMGARRLF